MSQLASSGFRDRSDRVRRGGRFFLESAFYIAKRERLVQLAKLGGWGTRDFPKCQCSLCHDWFRGGRVRGAIFSRELLLHRKAMSVQVGGGFRGGRTGSFSGGGAVMAPLRRAGLTGSLLFQGNRSDLGLRGREGCRAGLPFRSALLRAEDREAERGRDWATGARGDGSRW